MGLSFFKREPEMSVETRGRDSARLWKVVGFFLMFVALFAGLVGAVPTGPAALSFGVGVLVFFVGRVLE